MENNTTTTQQHNNHNPLLIILTRNTFLDHGHLRREIDGIDTSYDCKELENGVKPEIELPKTTYGSYDELMEDALACIMRNTDPIEPDDFLISDKKVLSPKVRRLSGNYRRKPSRQEAEAIDVESGKNKIHRHKQDKKTTAPKTGLAPTETTPHLSADLEREIDLILSPKHNRQSTKTDPTTARELDLRIEERLMASNKYFEFDITYVDAADTFARDLLNSYDIRIKTKPTSEINEDGEFEDDTCIILMPMDWAAYDPRLKCYITGLLIQLHRQAEFDRNPDTTVLKWMQENAIQKKELDAEENAKKKGAK
jgi:hypothetical protein